MCLDEDDVLEEVVEEGHILMQGEEDQQVNSSLEEVEEEGHILMQGKDE